MEHALTKVCNANHDDWDLNILVVLWASHTACKIFLGKTPFKLVYAQQEVMSMEYIAPSLCIALAIGMDDEAVLEERVA